MTGNTFRPDVVERCVEPILRGETRLRPTTRSRPAHTWKASSCGCLNKARFKKREKNHRR